MEFGVLDEQMSRGQSYTKISGEQNPSQLCMFTVNKTIIDSVQL